MIHKRARESKDIGDTGTLRTNRTTREEKQADKRRTTGPSRQDHALPLLRHFDRYQRRYVLEFARKRHPSATDNHAATMYMMFRMVFGHKTWY